MTKAIALLSGGLDSMLAIRIVQQQGIEVEAVNFQTVFTCCKDLSAQAAHELDVRLTVVGQDDDYLDLLREPRYGYGKGANPCIDCRIYMFERAYRYAQQAGADFLISGEVVGQRPMSQKRRDLLLISKQSELDDRLLRPLSAKLLPPTLPEREGLIDRDRLYGFSGRSRKGLIALAKELGLKSIPSPSTGCSLTEKNFAPKVMDLIQLDPEAARWDFELLNVGRHIRFDAQTKLSVGRNESENALLESMYAAPESRGSLLFTPDGFQGPTVLGVGPMSQSAIDFAGGVLLKYSRHADPDDSFVLANIEGENSRRQIFPHELAAAACTL